MTVCFTGSDPEKVLQNTMGHLTKVLELSIGLSYVCDRQTAQLIVHKLQFFVHVIEGEKEKCIPVELGTPKENESPNVLMEPHSYLCFFNWYHNQVDHLGTKAGLCWVCSGSTRCMTRNAAEGLWSRGMTEAKEIPGARESLGSKVEDLHIGTWVPLHRPHWRIQFCNGILPMSTCGK